MSDRLTYGEEASRRLEAMYLTEDVVNQRKAVLQAVGINAGECVLDLGSGPGFLTAEIAQGVGPSGAVHGVDISDVMVDIARRRCSNHPNVEFRVADARDLPYEDTTFDVIVSTQVLEYIEDPIRVLEQAYRVMRPGARIAILATDWNSIVWRAPDAGLMSRVLDAWADHCADPYLPRILSRRLLDSGFQILDRSIVPIYNPGSHADTYSGGLIDLIADFVSGKPRLTDEELSSWASGLRALSERHEYFFSLNRYLFVAERPK